MLETTRLLLPETAALRVLGVSVGEQLLTLNELAELPQKARGPLAVVCMTGREVRAERIYTGWLLKDILLHCGLGGAPRSRLKQSLVLCRAQDGYRAIFTWHEIFNTLVGDGVLVVHEGGAVDTTEGSEAHLTLISAEDIRGGPRNLQRLVSIELAILPG